MSSKPKRLNKRVDYRSQFWGHAISIERNGKAAPTGAPLFTGHCFVRGLAEGDELLIPMGSGRDAVFKVTKVRTPYDPGDQHFIAAYPTHYLDEEGGDRG